MVVFEKEKALECWGYHSIGMEHFLLSVENIRHTSGFIVRVLPAADEYLPFAEENARMRPNLIRQSHIQLFPNISRHVIPLYGIDSLTILVPTRYVDVVSTTGSWKESPSTVYRSNLGPNLLLNT